MNIHDPTFRQQVYDLMTGTIVPSELHELEIIKNEFDSGSFCSTAYSQELQAYSRICQRLGQDEWDDPDVEIIISNFMSIGEYLSLKMFEYGVYFFRLCGHSESLPGWETP